MPAHHLFPSQPPSQKPKREKEVEMVTKKARNKFIIISNLLRGVIPLTFLFLLIEYFDELNYGIENVALPAIRLDLGVSYVQIGMLLWLPGSINTLIEPELMLVVDT